MDTETVTVPATPEPGSAKEPLISVGTITALVAAALTIAAIFGLKLTADQTATILGVVAILAPLVVTFVGRLKVFSPATTRTMVVNAAATGTVPTVTTVKDVAL